MTIFLTTLHVLVCIVLIVVVLLQRGKGAELGAVFGGGASSTVFGGRGAGNFLTRLTTGSAVVFMVTSMSLAVVGNQNVSESLFEDPPAAEGAGEAAADSPLVEIENPGLETGDEPAEAAEAAEVEPAPDPVVPEAEDPAPAP